MTATVENSKTLAEHMNPDGSGSLQISVSWQIDPVTAWRKAGRFIGGRVGNLLFGGEPSLVVGERTLWRVPILLHTRVWALSARPVTWISMP